MKKKVIGLLLLLCMVLGIVACGKDEGKDESEDEGKNAGSNSATVITIEGKKYDLADDFQKVVGQMVKDGILVYDRKQENDGYINYIYDENGCLSKSDVKDVQINATEKMLNQENGLVFSTYNISSKVAFETTDGINDSSTMAELDELDKYISGVVGANYIALYQGGQYVDLEKYSDLCEEYITSTEEMTPAEATKKYMPYGLVLQPQSFNGQLWMLMNKDAYLGARFRQDVEKYEYNKMQIMLLLAATDSYEMMKEGKIKSYNIISYTGNEKVMVSFQHYTYDPKWDVSKFDAK